MPRASSVAKAWSALSTWDVELAGIRRHAGAAKSDLVDGDDVKPLRQRADVVAPGERGIDADTAAVEEHQIGAGSRLEIEGAYPADIYIFFFHRNLPPHGSRPHGLTSSMGS